MLILVITAGVITAAVIVWLIWGKRSGIISDIDRVSRDRSGRIDVYSQDTEFELIDVKVGGTLKPRCDYARWLAVADQKKHWFVEAGVSGQWENIWIEFTPSATGYLFINLRGSFYENVKQYHHDVWVDDCKVEGGALMNGDFEMIGSDGKPAYWGWSGAKERYSIDSSEAHTGSCCVLVWHDIPLLQKIEVRAQKRYKVSAWFKSYKVRRSSR